jgi:3-oxoacyl-[acyl-carrier protein] reductase
MKKAIITGGSKGIGKELCKAFAQNGYMVVSTYNNTIPEKIENVTYLKCDISKDCESFFNQALTILGNIDVLVNNAGMSVTGVIQDFCNDEFDKVFSTNLKSIFQLSGNCASIMVKNKSGCIINISSMWGICGASCESLYSASKGAVINLTKSLAKELGPSNIRVNCVAPGVVKTDMIKCYSEEDLQELASMTPLQRLGTPADIAEAVLFLASEKASFITGQTLCVDGGFIL